MKQFGCLALFLVGCSGGDFVQADQAAGGSGSGGSSAGSSAQGGVGGVAGSGGFGGSASGGSDGGGSSGGSGGSGADGGHCDSASHPSEDACVVNGVYGVFVTPAGNDTSGDGSRAQPFKTLGRGLAAAKAAGKRAVYACATQGSYADGLVINNFTGEINLYGRFRCDANWQWDDSIYAKVNPGSGYALRGTNITKAMTIEGFEFVGGSASSPGSSSVAGFLVDSPGLTIRNSVFIAQAGANGATGVAPTIPQPAPSHLLGKNATQSVAVGDIGHPGVSAIYTCPADNVTTVGGSGGHAFSESSFRVGAPGTPKLGSDEDGAAGEGGAPCSSGGAGKRGANGGEGDPGDGAKYLGELTAAGWAPSAGMPGHIGKTAQGGGGGRGANYSADPNIEQLHGGGGGAGGCGGAGGGAGGGGGGSIGLMLLNSPVQLVGVSFLSGNGGDGGQGVVGSLGVSGGLAGKSSSSLGVTIPESGTDPLYESCDGGPGGDGGQGGPGGGGAGGISVGVLFLGDAPTLEDETILVGDAGASGGGPIDNTALEGVPGLATTVLNLNPEATEEGSTSKSR